MFQTTNQNITYIMSSIFIFSRPLRLCPKVKTIIAAAQHALCAVAASASADLPKSLRRCRQAPFEGRIHPGKQGFGHGKTMILPWTTAFYHEKRWFDTDKYWFYH